MKIPFIGVSGNCNISAILRALLGFGKVFPLLAETPRLGSDSGSLSLNFGDFRRINNRKSGAKNSSFSTYLKGRFWGINSPGLP